MLGSRLRQQRKQRKLTQEDVAQRIGVARTTYAMYEQNSREPDNETLQKLADFFEVSVDYLLGRTDDPSPPEKTSSSHTNIPSWATRKDVRDFKKMLEEDAPAMFDGVPLDEEDKEKIKRVLEAMFWDAKRQNKRKPIKE